ncbi:MAG: 3-oxoacyl-[acyl-carrier-protein] reductase [Elusimicrobiota bacterium]|jgi:3-oxoacyl-[acyl-carrier protein] reductase|nr:3-oxoacyl-[acyl-carrier-protein] reductase [Elusimicrobiota bacterium]
MDFKGKKVVITGASRGIGLGLAKAFLANGADIAICATSPDTLAKAKETLKALNLPGKIYTQKVDVSSASECEDFINNIIKEYGQIDVLINNAAVTKDTLLIRMSEQDWDKVLSINLKGAFLMSKAALKYMMKARSGNIVNMTSVVGQMGNGGQANYSASKAGIIGLTKSLAREFASRNIRINAVAPGFVKTEMTAALKEETQKEILENIPLKRFAEITDIASAVMFLASDDAGYITGQTISVNGGLYI